MRGSMRSAMSVVRCPLSVVRGMTRVGNGQRTTDGGSVSVAVAVADALHEAALLVGQGADALALDLFEQLVHAPLLRLALLLLLLDPAGGPLLQPALPPAGPARPGGPGLGRLVPLQAGVAL